MPTRVPTGMGSVIVPTTAHVTPSIDELAVKTFPLPLVRRSQAGALTPGTVASTRPAAPCVVLTTSCAPPPASSPTATCRGTEVKSSRHSSPAIPAETLSTRAEIDPVPLHKEEPVLRAAEGEPPCRQRELCARHGGRAEGIDKADVGEGPRCHAGGDRPTVGQRPAGATGRGKHERHRRRARERGGVRGDGDAMRRGGHHWQRHRRARATRIERRIADVFRHPIHRDRIAGCGRYRIETDSDGGKGDLCCRGKKCRNNKKFL